MIQKFDYYFPASGENRRIHLYLPDEYEYTDERYPVLYMFDGHNLFFDSDATYGKSWGLKEFLDGWHKRLIVVGMECAGGNKRLSEYSPYDFYSKFAGGKVVGLGKQTMDWLCFNLKPYIDAHYRTWWHREATAIAGSSMGGLMAAYAIVQYNQFFSKAAAVSPAVGLVSKEMLRAAYIGTYLPDNRLFLSWGTREGSPRFMGYYAHTILRLEKILMGKGFQTYIYEHTDGKHCEACWEQEVPTWMHFLWE